VVDRADPSQEFFWSFPDLEPLYNAARSYLEISQRIDLLNARVDVSSSTVIRGRSLADTFAGPARYAEIAQGECEQFPWGATGGDRHCAHVSSAKNSIPPTADHGISGIEIVLGIVTILVDLGFS
jgi:hypothetical protein